MTRDEDTFHFLLPAQSEQQSLHNLRFDDAQRNSSEALAVRFEDYKVLNFGVLKMNGNKTAFLVCEGIVKP